MENKAALYAVAFMFSLAKVKAIQTFISMNNNPFFILGYKNTFQN